MITTLLMAPEFQTSVIDLAILRAPSVKKRVSTQNEKKLRGSAVQGERTKWWLG